MTPEALRRRAEAWMALDPDPATVAATRALLDAGDLEALRDAFGARLEFGTAGMRGPLGPGPNRMNRLQVRQVSRALAAAVLGEGGAPWSAPTSGPPRAVVGFDARHGSSAFARDTAEVLAEAGLVVHLFDRVGPTPELAHAVLALGAQVGVMVTASHNPPADNGYKVYGPTGGQIVPPWDARIAALVDAESGSGSSTLAALRDAGRIRSHGTALSAAAEAGSGRSALAAASSLPVPAWVRDRYVDGVLALRVHAPARSVRVVYTAMHGVACELLQLVFDRAGHRDLHLVPSQCSPDPDFPTVAFPNPEEPGALDRASALAAELGADLLLANDPDGDRLAVAIPDRGDFRPLTGNEVGVLLADDLLGGRPGRRPLVATTVVSSSLLARVAEAHGAEYAETLTGFKWLADLATRHEAGGGCFVLGFEEALGVCAGSLVRDKDGISAALLVTDLAAHLATRGETLRDRLDQLAVHHGLHVSAQHSLTLTGRTGVERIAAAMDRLRRPRAELGGVPVARVRDLLSGTATLSDGSTRPVDLPRSNVLAFDLADGSRVLARPSGTEPKLKIYFEVRQPLADRADRPVAEAEATERIRHLRDATLRAADLPGPSTPS